MSAHRRRKAPRVLPRACLLGVLIVLVIVMSLLDPLFFP